MILTAQLCPKQSVTVLHTKLAAALKEVSNATLASMLAQLQQQEQLTVVLLCCQ